MRVIFNFLVKPVTLAWLLSSYSLGQDVLHYRISLIANDNLSHLIGKCDIVYVYDRDTLHLSCTPRVDSVHMGGKKLVFVQSANQLGIPLRLNSSENRDSLTIYYQTVVRPNQGFGGLSVDTSGPYLYNLGISIDGQPHTDGKAWFPCHDTWDDKASFEVNITSPNGLMGISGGKLVGVKRTASYSTYSWQLVEPIPPYLASIAIGNYNEIVLPSPISKLPISVYCYPKDRVHAEATFLHLPSAVKIFTEALGSYGFERVGYVEVPFRGGAMEHATNVAYPEDGFGRGQLDEELWVHELAHSWLGNLVTCKDASQMWLNEGLASWAVGYYLEQQYGEPTARAYFATSRQRLLSSGQASLSLVPMPEPLTYSATTYLKGAIVAEAMRKELGNGVFLTGLKNYFQRFAYANATHNDLWDCFIAAGAVPGYKAKYLELLTSTSLPPE